MSNVIVCSSYLSSHICKWMLHRFIRGSCYNRQEANGEQIKCLLKFPILM